MLYHVLFRLLGTLVYFHCLYPNYALGALSKRRQRYRRIAPVHGSL